MAAEKTRPLDVVVPRSEGDIIIRQFQCRDAAQVHAMLIEGLVYGPESPRNVALRRNLSSPISCLAYTGFGLGAACFMRQNYIFRIGGAALCLAAATLFICVRRSITKMFLDFCASARKTDMANIPKSYEVPLPLNDVQPFPPQGPGGFWVAAIESPNQKTSEVVGYVGADYHANTDPSSAELRRMIVSMRLRRRGIGSLLISAVIAHAQSLAPLLETLELETTEFQPGPRKLYEKHGFSFVGTRVIRMPLFQVTVLRFRRKVFTDEQ
ncbi:hypothetical protein DFH07DRAFT_78715 [Mycena maculata]|uniref:N-acetyltransferase domain-containing protein n=1 Tax=Mycena maculata TaxID=230809 RepID=A0AAD7IDC0_9AGAR|nr:hypothetical protein DFH07DRAFT_78715 [Mycena maculata]